MHPPCLPPDEVITLRPPPPPYLFTVVVHIGTFLLVTSSGLLGLFLLVAPLVGPSPLRQFLQHPLSSFLPPSPHLECCRARLLFLLLLPLLASLHDCLSILHLLVPYLSHSSIHPSHPPSLRDISLPVSSSTTARPSVPGRISECLLRAVSRGSNTPVVIVSSFTYTSHSHLPKCSHHVVSGCLLVEMHRNGELPRLDLENTRGSSRE